MVKYNFSTKFLINRCPTHSAGINCLKFVPDSSDSEIITGSSDDTIRVWDLQGNEVKFFGGHFGAIQDLDFSEIDGKPILVSGAEDGTVLIWDFISGECISSIVDAKNVVRAVKIKENILISGSKDKHLRIYDLTTEKIMHDLEIGVVTVIVIHPSQNICFVGTTSNSIYIIDFMKGEILNCVKAHDLPLQGLDISSKGNLLVSSSLGKDIKIWNLAKLPNLTELASIEAHRQAVTSVKFTPDKDSIGTGSFDRSVKIFNPGNNKPFKTFRGPKLAVTELSWSKDSTILAYASADGSFRIQNIGETKPYLEKSASKYYISTMFVDKKSNQLFAGYGDGTLNIFSLIDFSIEKTIKDAHVAKITKILIHQEKLITVSEDKLVKIWELPSLKLVLTGESHSLGITDSLLLDDGSIVTVSSDGHIKKWDFTQLEVNKSVKTHNFSVNSINLTNNGKYIATTSNDKQVILHNLELEAIKIIKGHKDTVLSSCFSKDDKLLFSGARNGEILIFDVEEGVEITSLDVHSDEVIKMQFSEDFHYFAVISSDHNLSLFHLDDMADGYNLRNINFTSFHGRPVDFVWLSDDSNSDERKLLLSTEIGELIEFTITPLTDNSPEIKKLDKVESVRTKKEASPVNISKEKISSKRKTSKKKATKKKKSIK